MLLGQKQRQFAFHVHQLIQHIYAMGYEVTLGDAFRDKRALGERGDEGPYGRNASAHKQRLAIDLNLFVDNQWIRATAPYKPFGTYWKALHKDNEWGGDFPGKGDGNHFSRRHNNIA